MCDPKKIDDKVDKEKEIKEILEDNADITSSIIKKNSKDSKEPMLNTTQDKNKNGTNRKKTNSTYKGTLEVPHGQGSAEV